MFFPRHPPKDRSQRHVGLSVLFRRREQHSNVNKPTQTNSMRTMQIPYRTNLFVRYGAVCRKGEGGRAYSRKSFVKCANTSFTEQFPRMCFYSLASWLWVPAVGGAPPTKRVSSPVANLVFVIVTQYPKHRKNSRLTVAAICRSWLSMPSQPSCIGMYKIPSGLPPHVREWFD